MGVEEIRERLRALGVDHEAPECDPAHGPGVVVAVAYGGTTANRLEREGLRLTPVGTKYVLVRERKERS